MKIEEKQMKFEQMLRQGIKGSAVYFNKMLNTGDTRKMVSRLRRNGLNIQDYWITTKEGTRYKVYYL